MAFDDLARHMASRDGKKLRSARLANLSLCVGLGGAVAFQLTSASAGASLIRTLLGLATVVLAVAAFVHRRRDGGGIIRPIVGGAVGLMLLAAAVASIFFASFTSTSGDWTYQSPLDGAADVPSSTKDLDALWALAPDRATLGLVVSPRGVAMLERAVLAVQALMNGAPDLGPARQALEQELTELVGTAKPTLGALGMTRHQGFALFMVNQQMIAVLPVNDREKFLATVHGTKSADGDSVAGFVCKTLDRRYVCAKDRALFGQLGHAGLTAARAAADARGDIELAATHFTDPDSAGLAAVAQVDTGVIVVRGAVIGLPQALVGRLGAAGKASPESESAAGFGVIDLSVFFLEPSTEAIAPHVSLGDLGKAIAGPLTFVIAAGTGDVAIRVPLRAPSPAAAWVAHCADSELFTALGASAKDGTCHIARTGLGVELDGLVDGKELRFDSRLRGRPAQLAPSPLAAELARGTWTMAFYGRGGFLDPFRAFPAMNLDVRRPDSLMVARLYMLCNELGLGVRVDRDTVRFIAGIRTAWTNPDDVLRKLFALSPAQLVSGGIKEVARAIATAAPAAPFAEDFKASPDGMAVAAPLGLFTRIAIPALMPPRRRP
jgi:hypothetical protein